MRKATVIYLIKDHQVLLAVKKDKVGKGRFNGYGGKIEGSESWRECAVRELFTESSQVLVVKENDLKPRAVIQFFNPGNDADLPNMEVAFYITDKFQGDTDNVKENAEMEKPQWYAFDQLPFNQMMVGDYLFVPNILRGECLKGSLHFTEGFKDVAKFQFFKTDENSLEI